MTEKWNSETEEVVIVTVHIAPQFMTARGTSYPPFASSPWIEKGVENALFMFPVFEKKCKLYTVHAGRAAQYSLTL